MQKSAQRQPSTADGNYMHQATNQAEEKMAANVSQAHLSVMTMHQAQSLCSQDH